MTNRAVHACAVASNGAKTWGDAGITPRQQTTGVYTLELDDALAQDEQSAILVTRRGVALRYYVAVQHTGDTVRRIVVRDFAATVLDSAFDVLIMAQSGSAAIGEHCRGSVTSAGALLSGSGFTPARSQAGIYTLTLATPIAATACVVQASRRGTGARYFVCVDHTSDAVKTVRVVDETDTFSDAAFDFSIWRAT